MTAEHTIMATYTDRVRSRPEDLRSLQKYTNQYRKYTILDTHYKNRSFEP